MKNCIMLVNRLKKDDYLGNSLDIKCILKLEYSTQFRRSKVRGSWYSKDKAHEYEMTIRMQMVFQENLSFRSRIIHLL